MWVWHHKLKPGVYRPSFFPKCPLVPMPGKLTVTLDSTICRLDISVQLFKDNPNSNPLPSPLATVNRNLKLSSNVEPTAGFSFMEEDQGQPFKVLFHPSDETKSGNDRTYDASDIVRYEWDFGDGVGIKLKGPGSNNTNDTNTYDGRVSHIYSDNSDSGHYNVTLTVTDSRGSMSRFQKCVSIPIAPNSEESNIFSLKWVIGKLLGFRTKTATCK